MITSVNIPTLAAISPGEEPEPEPQSLPAFFAATNAAIDGINAKILDHADALPGPGLARPEPVEGGQSADPEVVKTSISIIRSLECATRALKRSQDMRIAQEKILNPKPQKKKEEEQTSHDDYEAQKREYIACLQREREWRRIGRSHQREGALKPAVLCNHVLPTPHSAALEPDAPETPADIQILPAAPMYGSSTSGEQPESTVTDLWTAQCASPAGSPTTPPCGDSPQNGSEINAQEPDSADSQPALPAGAIHHSNFGDNETSAPAPSQPEERDPAQRASQVRLLARA